MPNSFAQVDIWAMFDNVVHMNVSSQALAMCVVFSFLGAVILGKFTGSFGNIAFPLNFAILFIGTFVTNCMFDGIDIPTFQFQQEVLLITIVGMISTSIAMLWILGTEN
jgi:hypothetical protein